MPPAPVLHRADWDNLSPDEQWRRYQEATGNSEEQKRAAEDWQQRAIREGRLDPDGNPPPRYTDFGWPAIGDLVHPIWYKGRWYYNWYSLRKDKERNGDE